MTTLEERVAKLEVIAERQDEQLQRMVAQLDTLLALANRGKGAIGVLIGIGGLVGAAATWFLQHLGGQG